MSGSNPSTDSRTNVKCSAHSSVHPGIKFTKVAYLIKFLNGTEFIFSGAFKFRIPAVRKCEITDMYSYPVPEISGEKLQ
jgi:hypothetical protein